MIASAQSIVDGERDCRGASATFASARGKVERWLFGVFDLMPVAGDGAQLSPAEGDLVGDLTHLAGVATDALHKPLYQRAADAAAGTFAAMMTVAETGQWLQKNAPSR